MKYPKPQVPAKRLAFAEIRAFRAAIRLLAKLGRRRHGFAQIDNAPHVIIFPGFGSTDLSTLLTRRYLARHGISCEGWKNGRNMAGKGLIDDLSELGDTWDITISGKPHKGEGSVPALCDVLTEHVRQRVAELGRPVILVGWSLGGYVAREVTRELPEGVVALITMGSPVIGGPKYTAAAPYFLRQGQDVDWIEAEVDKRNQQPIQQPVTVIFSKTDAIVDWRAAQDHTSPNLTTIEIDTAHLAMGFDLRVLDEVVNAVRRQADA